MADFTRDMGSQNMLELPLEFISSICMWAYAGEIYFSLPASKNFPLIIPHTVPKGGGHGFNGSIYF